MTKKITKNKGGRPTDLTPDTVTKLESIFKIGGTIEEATSYAGISRQTYYRWLDQDKSFVTKMEAAKHYADIVAKNVVVDSIIKDKDLSSAKWWLEKREFKDINKLQLGGDNSNVQINIISGGYIPEPVQVASPSTGSDISSGKIQDANLAP